MQVIGELVALLAAAIAALVMAMVGAIAVVLSVLLEFIFLALTEGVAEAIRRSRQRKLFQGSTSLETNKEKAKAALPLAVGSERSVKQAKAIAVGCVVFSFIAMIAAFVAKEHIEKRRNEATDITVEILADRIESKIRQKIPPAPVSGWLPELDAWGNNIELIVDKTLVITFVMVRSPGRDAVPTSLDDCFAIRVIKPEGIDAVVKPGKFRNMVFDQVIKLFPGLDQKKLGKALGIDEK